MAIFKLDIVDIELNNGSVHRSFMNKTLGEGDKQANRFGVHLLRNGEEVSLEDATCTGYFIRADGGTVVIPGIVNENLAYVRLPETCYAIEGQFSLAIKVESGTVIGTMRIIDGVVANVSTDAIVDPGTILPSIEDLIDAIDEAVSSIPADYSGLWECLAPNYSNEKLYRKGQYCTYDGGVYRCLINIEATENWKPAHWQQVTIGDQLMSVMETNPENKWTAGDLIIPEDDGYLNLADIDEGISLPAGTYNLSGVAFSEGANTDIRFRFNADGDTVNVDLVADGLFHDTTFTLSAAATLIRVQTGHTVETSEGFGGYLNHVTLIEADSSAGFIPNITAVDSIARLPNVYPSGLTDGTDADNMINAIRLTGGYCKLAPGTYYIDVMAFPSTPATIEGSGKETVIVVDKDADYTYGIRLSNNSAIRHLTVKSSDSTYTPADIYTGTVKHGINIRPATGTGKTHVSIEDVTVENFSGAGILLNQTGQDSDDGCHVLNCFVSNCGAGIWTNTNAEFNRIDCCNFAGCYYGAINDGGNNVFSNCGFSGNKYGFFMDNTSGNLTNNSHGSVIGCVFNHEDYDSTTLGKGYGIYLIGVTSGMQFVGGQLFYAGIYLKDCTAVVISNFNFGKMIENSTDVGVKIEVVRTSGNRLLLLTDSVFAIAPRITATSSANQKVFVNSCYTRDGALIPSITPGFTPTTEIAPQYSASSTYAVGQYVFYNGELKRCTTAITTAEAYTAAHWTDATLASDVSDLKSAFDEVDEIVRGEPNYTKNCYITTGDVLTPDSGYNVSKYISINSGSATFYYGTYNSKIKLLAYNSSKEKLDDWGASSNAQYRVITLPANTAYVRFAFNKGYTGKLMRGSYLAWQAQYIGGLADDIDDIKDDITDINNDITELSGDMDTITETRTATEIIIPEITTLTYGYVATDGTVETEPSTNVWFCNKFAVQPGDVLSRTSGGLFRFVTAYNGNSAVSASGKANVSTFTVPDDIDGIIISISGDSTEQAAQPHFAEIRISRGTDYFCVKMDDTLTSSLYPPNAKLVGDLFCRKAQSKTWRGDLSANTSYDTGIAFAPKIGFKCGLYAEFSGSFDKITLQFDAYSPNQIIVDDEKVYFKSRFIGDSSQAHGITISGHVYINAFAADPNNIKVTISSNGTQATIEKRFSITAYETFKIVNGTQALSNAVFTMGCGTINHPIWLIGDSYFGMTDDNRWPYYAYQNGYVKNAMFCGSTGSGHTEFRLWFESLIQYGLPRTIVWCMGMNYASDGESAPDTTWKKDTDYLIDFCEANAVELILATIPTVPSINHEQKNAYVKASGHRYIDFAKAVGAQSDGTWYTGMLANDNIHPTTTGAIALYNMAISSVPELAFDYE